MPRLRRKDVMHGQPTEFSPVLFDTLFGLLMFLGIGSLASVRGGTHLAFSLIGLAAVAHAWLKRKAAEATYGSEVVDSSLRLLFGLMEVALLQLAMLAISRGAYAEGITYFALALLIESMQALVWRCFGSWKRNSHQRVRFVEQQLDDTIFLGLAMASVLGGLVAFAPGLAWPDVAMCFGWAYGIYMAITYARELIHVRLM